MTFRLLEGLSDSPSRFKVAAATDVKMNDMPKDTATKTATLHRMVMTDHMCPYGLKSKDLLERQGYQVEDRHLTSREEMDAFKVEHGVATTPQTRAFNVQRPWVFKDTTGRSEICRPWRGSHVAM
ncbi:hypothetical protein SAMN04488527_1722 [Aliiroseovarius crassostreae]|uniref:Glutaredoxin domain-containing protein n=1 Tax=Aliiroseovarius crassostreae TaxID=154981 RepID=A0A0P7JNF0_9RHOB|nr:hypothetical protein AKJ29_00090 [Aliiroseovarius crassostreae]SFU98644.1 hypothetical protein SAMN04488527_1722 [Aliiroseovarius crassostreae]